MYSQQAYTLENKLHRWPRHVGKMWTTSTIMVRVLAVDGPQVRILPMADETNAGKSIITKFTIYVCFVLQHTLRLCVQVGLNRSLRFDFWPTVLSVVPLVHYVVCVSVCLSSVCDVLYCGKTVRPSEKVSEGVNRKPGSKSWFFWVAAIFLLPVSRLRPPRRPFLPYFCLYSPAIDTRWYKLTF